MLNAAGLSALMSAQLKKGVFTNSAMTAAEYLEDDPSLEVFQEDGALLIFRRREGFLLMNYYVQQDCGNIELPDFCAGIPVVCETAYKPRDEEAASRVMGLLAPCGFEPALERIRLTRKDAGDVVYIENKTEEPSPCLIREFLKEQFNAFTGCIPPEHLMGKDRFVWTGEDGDIGGVLHFSVSKNYWEIRHLAVAEKLRGTGAAAKLLDEAQTAAGSLPCRVWTGADNIPAIKFYEKHGFNADAYRSTVLIRK